VEGVPAQQRKIPVSVGAEVDDGNIGSLGRIILINYYKLPRLAFNIISATYDMI